MTSRPIQAGKHFARNVPKTSARIVVGYQFSNRVSLQGYVPEAQVAGNGVGIADGDATPALADHTDFGAVVEAGGMLTRT